jgi:bis(5'-nucleosyl)-tetraphosphatase (symmetrical)
VTVLATYAIGDVQGCYDELRQLLDRIAYEPGRDRLWLTGDLVNRGPRSAQVLRLVRALGESAVVVLGNHDLHLLALAEGDDEVRAEDNLADVLLAEDRDELLHWLRHRPLLHHDEALGLTLIHAGLPPQWGLDEARAHAAEVEQTLRGPAYEEFFAHMYGDEPSCWSPELGDWDRLRFIVNCLTRLRYCDRAGHIALHEKGPPGSQPQGLLPLVCSARTPQPKYARALRSLVGAELPCREWVLRPGQRLHLGRTTDGVAARLADGEQHPLPRNCDGTRGAARNSSAHEVVTADTQRL